MRAVVGELKEQLRDAYLVRAQPWQSVAQSSSMVLLKGQLRTSGRTSRHQGVSRASKDWDSAETREAAWQQRPPGDPQPDLQDHKYDVKVSKACWQVWYPALLAVGRCRKHL